MRAYDPFRQIALALKPVAITLAVLTFTSVTGNAADSGLSQNARISHACGMILGLDRSEAPYDACVRSLSHSAAENAAAMAGPPQMMIQLACGNIGLKQDTPEFVQCAADLRGSLEQGLAGR